jgi:hypothetical protein
MLLYLPKQLETLRIYYTKFEIGKARKYEKKRHKNSAFNLMAKPRSGSKSLLIRLFRLAPKWIRHTEKAGSGYGSSGMLCCNTAGGR